MLGEGLRAGLQYLGIAHRTILYIEREAYAASVLAARMQEGSLDAAPIWPDLLTFDARRWRGAVDCIVAGFPCQDLSLAGRRAGLDGARSGLFFDILDIADACGARGLFLENVAGIASATASVMDEAEGALEERASARVLGELADRGWNAEWITLSASDVGASHGRARWFCWAWRMGDTGLQHQHLQQRQDGAEHSGAGQPMAHAERAERAERWPKRAGGVGSIQGHDGGWREAHRGPGISGEVLGHANQQRTHRCGPPGQQAGGIESAHTSGCLDNPIGTGRNTRRDDHGSHVGHIVDPASQQLGYVADAECPCDRTQEHASDCGWSTQAERSADQHSGLCSPCVLAHTSSPRQQGCELGRACDCNGGAGNTWIS